MLKPVESNSSTDQTSFLGLHASIGTASIEGVPDFTFDVTGATATVNSATDSSGNPSSTHLDWSNVPGSGLTIGSAVSDEVTGGTSTLTVTGLGTVSVSSFSLAAQSGVTGSGSLGTGDLLSLTLGGPTLHAGGSAATLDLSGTTLDLRSFVASSTTTVYAAGSGLHLGATLGPVSASVDGVSFLYNPSAVTDWSFAGVAGRSRRTRSRCPGTRRASRSPVWARWV